MSILYRLVAAVILAVLLGEHHNGSPTVSA